MSTKKIVIGARGSRLSLIQAAIVKQLLERIVPDITIAIKIIKTQGDKNMKPIPLDTVGKGWFTEEIDKALLEGTIDIAVHSLKDIPEVLTKGLVLAAITEREDARDALVSHNGKLLTELKKHARIGTDSIRRKMQLLHKRPDLQVESIRGNVETRLKKLDEGDYDGIVLAVAGLRRLGLEKRITEYFSATDFIPSPGQGALAVVARKEDEILVKLLKKISHKITEQSVKAERSFAKTFGGGCKMPVGAYAEYKDEKLKLYGVVGSDEGNQLGKDFIEGEISASEKLAKELSLRMLRLGNKNLSSKYIVITRTKIENKNLQKELEQLGFPVLPYPTIKIAGITSTKITRKLFKDIPSFDWILFTSRNGVKYFMRAFSSLKLDTAVFAQIHFGAVGPKTAEEVKKYQLPVDSA